MVNCNLQRLDGPVRGNGKIIQELESLFRGAGWNCIKVIWGSDWDPLLEIDRDGRLRRRMDEVVDGQYQKYEPVDSEQLIYYREAEDGQILEEGITEAGSMGSFIAAGTSYAGLETPMIPFYLFYSMFGFQRVGDLIWAAADAQAKGFLLGCTAGRTTLNGEPATRLRPQLLASGPMVLEAERAQGILAEQFGVPSDLWSVTSFSQLRREAAAAERWNELHPGKIAKIHVAEGDTIGVGQTVLTLEDGEPDKDTSEAPAEETAAEPEEEQPEGPERKEPVAEEQEKDQGEKEPPTEETEAAPEREAEEEAETAPAQRKAEEDKEAGEEAEAPSGEAENHGPPPPAGPATRRLARKFGVDLHEVSGSGRSGRITQEDVVEARDRVAPGAAPGGAAQPPLPDFEKFGPVERQRLNKIARTAMKNLRASWSAVPHVTQHDVADVTDLEAARRRFFDGPGRSGPKITLTAIAVRNDSRTTSRFAAIPHGLATVATGKCRSYF